MRLLLQSIQRAWKRSRELVTVTRFAESVAPYEYLDAAVWLDPDMTEADREIYTAQAARDDARKRRLWALGIYS